MSISIDKFCQCVFELLLNKARSSSRLDEIDDSHFRLCISEEERAQLKSLNGFTKIDTNSNRFAVLFNNTNNDKFLLVSADDGVSINDDDDFYLMEPSFVGLGVLYKENLICVSNSISPEEIIESIFITEEDGYSGNTFDQLESFFPSFEIYKINNELALLNSKDPFRIYSYFLFKRYQLVQSHYSIDTLELFEKVILTSLEIPYRNIANALCSNQWEFSFLETYRLIEHAFPVTYLSELINAGISISPISVAELFENIIGWRLDEQKAVKKIIDEIKNDSSFANIIIRLESIIKDDTAIDKWYYKQIRNQIVHFRAIHHNLTYNDSEWDTLIAFNLQLIIYLYNKYHSCFIAVDSINTSA